MIAYLKRYKSKGYYDFHEGWIIPTTGGTPIQITDSSYHVTGPIWSPDGKMIAFNSRKDPEGDNINQVLIVSIGEDGRPLDSSVAIKLPHETFLIPAGWSQSNKIGLQMVNPRYQAIYTVPFSGGKSTQVTPEGWGNNPCWSMDGKKILFRWADRFAAIPATGGEMSIIPVNSEEKTIMALPGGGNISFGAGQYKGISALKAAHRLPQGPPWKQVFIAERPPGIQQHEVEVSGELPVLKSVI